MKLIETYVIGPKMGISHKEGNDKIFTFGALSLVKYGANHKRNLLYMKKTLFTLFVLLSGISTIGQIPPGYYDDAQDLNGASLKSALYQIINDHNQQSYGSIWIHFEDTDPKPNGKVWDMYSDVPEGNPPYEYNFGDDQCGNYSGEGDCYNREHSFPKSWFDDAYPMYTDLFQIVPTDGYVNGQRSNWPYGETNNPNWTSQNGSKRGSNSTSGYSGTIFEPIDAYKGDFARIYFYMATRYENIIAGWENNSDNSDVALDGTSYPCYEEWYLNLLLDWHQNDPVSQKEIDRNNEIYDIQNNRNPFVDHPEWVATVWGGVEAPIISNVNHSPQFPEENELVTVSAQITDNGSINNANLKWGFSNSNLNSTVNMSNSGDNYSAEIPGQSAGQEVFYRIEATDNESNNTLSAIYNYQVNQNAGFIALPFLEDFNDETLGIFYQVSVSGPLEYWHNDDYQDDFYAKMSNFNGSDNLVNEDWMMTPAINFDAYSNEIMNFRSAMKDYSDNNCFIYLMYSTNYSGSGDPNNATWTDISSQASWSAGEYIWTASGEIDLSSISGAQVYIAFQYDSQSGSGKTWQIDDVSITADASTNNPPQITNVEHSPNTPEAGQVVSVSATITDDDGSVDDAKIFWGFSSANLDNEVIMSGSGDEYSGQIPGQAEAETIFYQIEAIDNDDASSLSSIYQYTVANAVNQAPVINDVSYTPTSPAEGEEVLVEAEITDDNGVESALVLWGLSAGSLTNTEEMPGSGDDYEAEIAGQNEGVTVYFKVRAFDEEGEMAETSTYQYTVLLNGNTAPVISNIIQSPEEPDNNDVVEISAQITDDQGVDVAELQYGTSPTLLNQIIDMSASGNQYQGNIPEQNAGLTIYYRIMAKDEEGAVTYSSTFSYFVDLAEGVDELEQGLWHIYPNPANDYIHFQSLQNDQVDLNVYHSSGKLILRKTSYDLQQPLDLYSLESGIYFIQITNTKKSETLSFIKK